MLAEKMSLSSAGIASLQKAERIRLYSYQDSGGVWTIGWGHTKDVTAKMACKQSEAVQWLREDTGWAADAVNAGLSRPVTQPQFDALVLFTFNVGAGGFHGSDLLTAINTGAGADKCVPLFFHYITAGGKVLAGLINRRSVEAALFVSA